MGFFSWETSDTNESVSNVYSSRGALPVKMIAPDGREWIEHEYEGYGEFGGKDFFELVDELNSNGSDRVAGIKLVCNPKEKDKPPLLPKIVSINCKTPYDDLPESKQCPAQGFFYSSDEE